MEIEFAYLDIIRNRIEEHTHTLLHLRDKYGDDAVVVDENKAAKLIEALERLKNAIETTSLK